MVILFGQMVKKNNMKKSVTIEVEEGLVLEIIGDYSPEEKEVRYYPDGSGYPGMPSYFEIEDIHIVKGGALHLMDYVANRKDLWAELEELVLKEIEEK